MGKQSLYRGRGLRSRKQRQAAAPTPAPAALGQFPQIEGVQASPYVMVGFPVDRQTVTINVNQDFINDVIEWGGEENIRWSKALQALKNEFGDFGYPMGVGSYPSVEVGSTVNGGNIFRENQDILLDLVDPFNGDANVPINRSYCVDDFPRVPADQVVQEPVKSYEPLYIDPPTSVPSLSEADIQQAVRYDWDNHSYQEYRQMRELKQQAERSRPTEDTSLQERLLAPRRPTT